MVERAGLTIQIRAPHFTAGVCWLDTDTTSAYRVAPILAYMRAWPADRVRSYAKRKGWSVIEL